MGRACSEIGGKLQSAQWHSHTALNATVSGSFPGRVGIFNEEFLRETRRDSITEPQSLISVPNTNVMAYGTRRLNAAFTRSLQ